MLAHSQLVCLLQVGILNLFSSFVVQFSVDICTLGPIVGSHQPMAVRHYPPHQRKNREFKVYDATVAKTSLKIASPSFSIYFAIMSVCLTFES